MNALSTAWKLRSDLEGILKAFAPVQRDRGSERRLARGHVARTKSDIRELLPAKQPAALASTGAADSDEKAASRRGC